MHSRKTPQDVIEEVLASSQPPTTFREAGELAMKCYALGSGRYGMHPMMIDAAADNNLIDHIATRFHVGCKT